MKKHYFLLLMLLGIMDSARAQTKTFTATGANQTYDVTSDGTVTITATGGNGSYGNNDKNGGSGAKISAKFTVKNGDKLIIVAGSNGSSFSGGGGSAVILQRTGIQNALLLVAGGGGGPTSFGGTDFQGYGGSSFLDSPPGAGFANSGDGGGGFEADGRGAGGGKKGTLQGGGNGGGADPAAGFGFGGGGGFGVNSEGAASGGGGGGYHGGSGGINNRGGFGGESYISSDFEVSGTQTEDGVKGGRTKESGSVVITFVASKPTLGTPAVTNVTCNGGSDGRISASATSGTPGYTFSLSPGNASNNTGSFTGLAAGSYTLTVTDAKGKSDSKQVTVGQPTAVTFTTTLEMTKCFGGSDGSISVTASGGTPGYTYSKDGGTSYGNSPNFTNLSAGNYNIRVKDNKGCTSEVKNINVGQPTAVAFTTTTQNVKCKGGSDGGITVTPSGGTPGYTYSLNGGEFGSSPTFTGLSAGDYAIRVKDANGCQTEPQTATVAEPTAVSVTAGPDKSVIRGFGGPNSTCTQLSASASGGTPGTGPAYTYVWMPGGQTGPTVTVCPLETTTYTVTATDANGCTATATQTVNVQDVRCGPKMDMVSICYYGVTQCVSEKIATRYLKLGATLGACGSSNNNKRIGAEEQANAPLQLTLKAFPNPVQDIMTLEVLAPRAGETTFEVLDLTGRSRQTRRENLTEGLNEIEFRLGSLPTGLYLIRAVDAAGRQGVTKVSKQ